MTRHRIRCPQCHQPGLRIRLGNGSQFVEHWASCRMDPTIRSRIRVCPLQKGH